VDARETVLTTADHDQPVRQVLLAADGAWLVSVSEGGKVVVVERESGRFVRVLRDVCDTVLGAAVSDDGETIAIAGGDLLVHVFSGEMKQHTLRGAHGAFQAIAISPDARRLVAGSSGGAIYLWDLETGERQFRLTEPGASVVTVGFDASGEQIVALDANGQVSLWDLGNGAPRRRSFDPNVSEIREIAIDPDGRWLVCGGREAISVIDMTRREPVCQAIERDPSDPATPHMIAVSADRRAIAIGRADGRVRVIAVPRSR
jgi:WD40 repeat protein